MTKLHAKQALLPVGWAENVRITVADGRIAGIETGVEPAAGDERHHALVPGMPNLHSHAFQRAMAGLAESRGPGEDNFWSWRTVMYRFALEMTPDQLEAIAAQLYMEMVEAGFCRVGEFHYLHHDRDGRPYADIAEHAARIAAASETAGISLTLLPVFYAHSDFGGQPPIDGQRRFINSVDRFEALMTASRRVVDRLEGGVLGVAPHSLRAVTPEELAQVVRFADGGPVHIHVAEQTREVEGSVAALGARPVEWLLANAILDESWCLIHATHMTEAETMELARSGAVAGLCPITEANLGDGIFNGATFLKEGGLFGVGSDSNVLISVAEELRQYEYSQRLGLRMRNVVSAPPASTGRHLFDAALAGGNRAMGVAGGLAQGEAADIVALSPGEADYWRNDTLLDHWIFAMDVGVDAAWVRGRKLVENGRHVRREAISARFRAAMRSLVA
jgi:formiminoglutamate deiminase